MASSPTPQIRQNQIIPNVSPNCTLATVGTAAAQIIGSNIVRRGITFANPSATATVWIAPAGVALLANTGIPLFPGATFAIQASGDYQANCAWQAIASAPGSPLTILEFV